MGRRTRTLSMVPSFFLLLWIGREYEGDVAIGFVRSLGCAEERRSRLVDSLLLNL